MQYKLTNVSRKIILLSFFAMIRITWCMRSGVPMEVSFLDADCIEEKKEPLNLMGSSKVCHHCVCIELHAVCMGNKKICYCACA